MIDPIGPFLGHGLLYFCLADAVDFLECTRCLMVLDETVVPEQLNNEDATGTAEDVLDLTFLSLAVAFLMRLEGTQLSVFWHPLPHYFAQKLLSSL